MRIVTSLKMLMWCFAITTAAPGFAQGLTIFGNGEIADADEINNNFSELNSRLTNVENMNFGFVGNNIQAYKLVQVDCSENAAALSQAWEANYATSQINFLINGRCEWPYPDVGFSGKSVIISGRAEGTTECPDVLPSIEATNLEVSYGALWLVCVKFDSSPFIVAYANGYIRLQDITKTSSDQTITVWIRNNSTLRVFGALQLSDVRAWGSHVNLRPYATPSIESLQLLASSTLWCNNCSGDITLLKLRDGSDASFIPNGSGLNVTTLDAAQGARISVNTVYADMVIAKEILTENAIVYRRSE